MTEDNPVPGGCAYNGRKPQFAAGVVAQCKRNERCAATRTRQIPTSRNPVKET